MTEEPIASEIEKDSSANNCETDYSSESQLNERERYISSTALFSSNYQDEKSSTRESDFYVKSNKCDVFINDNNVSSSSKLYENLPENENSSEPILFEIHQDPSTNNHNKNYFSKSHLNEHLSHHQNEKSLIKENVFSVKSNECNVFINDNNVSSSSVSCENLSENGNSSEPIDDNVSSSSISCEKLSENGSSSELTGSEIHQETSTNNCETDYLPKSHLNEHLSHHQNEKSIIKENVFSVKSNECNVFINDNNVFSSSLSCVKLSENGNSSEPTDNNVSSSISCENLSKNGSSSELTGSEIHQETSTNNCETDYLPKSHLNERLSHHQNEKDIIRENDFSVKSNECNVFINDNVPSSLVLCENLSENENSSEILSQIKENLCICNICQKTDSCEHSLNTQIQSHEDKKQEHNFPIQCDTQNNSVNQENKESITYKSFQESMINTNDSEISVPKTEKKFVCDICQKTYSHENHLRTHIIFSHKNENQKLNLEKLSSIFDSQTDVPINDYDENINNFLKIEYSEKIHLNMLLLPETKEESFFCIKCQEEFGKKVDLDQHTLTHIDDNSFICEVCRKEFPSEFLLTDHRKVHDIGKSYVCHICQRKYFQKKDLNRHLRAHKKGEESLYVCEICQKGYSSSYLLSKHLKIHSQDRPFVCNVCQKSFYQKCDLNKHINSHTGERPFVCNMCPRGFNTRHLLKNHLRSHTGEKPFSCETCKEKFSQRRELTKHIISHTGQKPFKCNFCETRFASNTALQRHVHSHSGEKPFVCDVCDKRFHQKSNLASHSILHSGVKRHSCEVCDMRFAQKSDLNVHVRSHTGEKPYVCDICQKAFSRRYILTKHLIAHTGVKAFACPLCQKRFAGKHNLERHLIIHADVSRERPFPCTECDKRFYQACHLRRHLSTVHGIS